MRKPKLLLVNELLQNVESFAEVSAQEEYDVLTTEDTSEVLDLVNFFNPDLIIVERNYSSAVSLEICKKIKNNYNFLNIPIILINQEEDQEGFLKSMEVGADDFLIRPFEEIEFITRIKILLKNKNLNDSLHYKYRELMYQVNLARKIQRSLNPPQKYFWGDITIDSYLLPYNDLGGDFLEIKKLNNHKIAILLGDAVGHGIPASLVAMMVKTLFSLGYQDSNPIEIIKNLNSDLYRVLGSNPENIYATAVLVIIDKDKEEIEIVNAGHPPIYLQKAMSNELIDSDGIPLGIYSYYNFNSRVFSIKDMEGIVMYTDGLLPLIDLKQPLTFLRGVMNTDKTIPLENLLDKNIKNIDNKDDISLVKILFKDQERIAINQEEVLNLEKMEYQSFIESYLKDNKIFEELYKIVRIVDPIRKRVLAITDTNNLEITGNICFDFWERNNVCENCISKRAFNEQKVFHKIDYVSTDNKIYLVTAVPANFGDRTVVIEMLNEVTGNLLLGNSKYDDIMEIYRIIKSINEFTYKDPLTKVFNEKYIEERLPEEIINNNIFRENLAIIILDIMNLNELYEDCGEVAVNIVLQKMVKNLGKDCSGETMWMARIARQKFLMCLPKTDKFKATEVLEGLRKKLETKSYEAGNVDIKLKVALGLCIVNEDNPLTDLESILANID